MDRSRRRRTNSAATTTSGAGGGEDELALVKAAAWAWYQRGSGNEGRAARESELGRDGGRARARRPSRYKLEALAAAVASEALEPRPDPVTLLDVYELERIRKELDRLATRGARGSRRLLKEAAGGKDAARKDAMAARGGTAGFLGRHVMGICGVGGGVVEARPRKAVAAVSPAMAAVV